MQILFIENYFHNFFFVWGCCVLFQNANILAIIVPLLMGLSSFAIKDNFKRNVNISYIAILGLLFFIIVASFFTLNLLSGKEIFVVIGGWSKAMGIELKYNAKCAFVLSFLVLITIIFLATNLKDGINYRLRGFAFIMLCGANGMIATNDIFNSYVFFEVVCITTYIFYAHSNNAEGLKNAYNYMILSSFAGVVFLLVAGLLYQISGNLNIDLIHNAVDRYHSNKTISACFVLFILVMIAKIGVYPFHGIMLGVYKNLSLNILMLVAGVSSIVYPYFIMKIVIKLFGEEVLSNNEYVCILLKALGGIGFLFFNFVALSVSSAVRFVIALSFAQTSFFAFCLPYVDNARVLNGTCLAITSNAIIKTCLLGLFYKIANQQNEERYYDNLLSKASIASISSKMYKILVVLLLFFVSGMPVSLVFMSKWHILFGILNSKSSILWSIILVSGFAIDITACFSFIKSIISRENDNEMAKIVSFSIATIIAIVVAILYIISASYFCVNILV